MLERAAGLAQRLRNDSAKQSSWSGLQAWRSGCATTQPNKAEVQDLRRGSKRALRRHCACTHKCTHALAHKHAHAHTTTPARPWAHKNGALMHKAAGRADLLRVLRARGVQGGREGGCAGVVVGLSQGMLQGGRLGAPLSDAPCRRSQPTAWPVP